MTRYQIIKSFRNQPELRKDKAQNSFAPEASRYQVLKKQNQSMAGGASQKDRLSIDGNPLKSRYQLAKAAYQSYRKKIGVGVVDDQSASPKKQVRQPGLEYSAAASVKQMTVNDYDREIKTKEADINTLAETKKAFVNLNYIPADIQETVMRYDDAIDRLSAEIERLKLEREEAERAQVTEQRKQTLAKFSSVADPNSVNYDPDFEEKSKYVSTRITDGSIGEGDSDYRDIDYEFINGNESISELFVGKYKNLYYIKESEKKLFNYYSYIDRTTGSNFADQYMSLIQEDLNDRASEEEYKAYEGKLFKELLYGVKSGLVNFGTATNNWYVKDDGYIPATATQLTAERIREDLADDSLSWYNFAAGKWEDKIMGKSAAQLVYDGIKTVSSAAPAALTTALIGAVNPAAGAVVGDVMSGAYSSGTAYQEKTNQGYTQEEAEIYATLVGVSDVAIQKVIDGMGGITGEEANRLVGNLSKVNKVLERVAKSSGGRYLKNAGDSFVAEMIQSYIEPWLWEAVSGEATSRDWEEELYASLIESLFGSILED